MNIDRIFLDLDDVLNDFTMKALRIVTGLSDFTFNPEWGYDIVRAAGALCTSAGVHPRGMHWRTDRGGRFVEFAPGGFWGQIKRHHWADMGVTDWCHELINICANAVGKKNVCILTSPVLDPDCAAGKMDWIYKEMPAWLHRQFLIGPCKQFCARPGSLLIDDCEENVKKFREYGGKGWEFPRPWNSRRDEDPQEWIKETGEILKTLAR